MFCTSKERETCGVEKRGCTGCYYDKEANYMDKAHFLKRIEELKNEVEENIEKVKRTGDFDFVSDYNASTLKEILNDIYHIVKEW